MAALGWLLNLDFAGSGVSDAPETTLTRRAKFSIMLRSAVWTCFHYLPFV